MKKLLFALVALLMAGNAMADRVVTIYPSDFTEMTAADAYSVEKDGIRVSVTNGMAKKNHIRIYKNETMTVELMDVPETHVNNPGISMIEVSCLGEDYDDYGPAGFTNELEDFRGEYTFDGYIGTWVDTEIEIPETMSDMYYEHAIAAALIASNHQVRVDQITVYIIGEDDPVTPVDPTEKTDAPSSAKENYVYNDGNLYYNAYTVTLTPTEPSTIYYRVGVLVDGDYVYGEWMEYTGELNFDDEGTYMIEAYAVAEGKAESDHIWDGFTVSKMVDVEELFAGKTVANVRYFNLMGQEMQQANGVTIMVTTFTDGTTNAVKVVK